MIGPTNMGDRVLRRTVCQDRKAIFEHLASHPTTSATLQVKGLSRIRNIDQTTCLAKQLTTKSYTDTDILQALGTLVLCCPADLVPYSAMARYVIRVFGQEEIFRLRPIIGKAVHLARSPTAQ